MAWIDAGRAALRMMLAGAAIASPLMLGSVPAAASDWQARFGTLRIGMVAERAGDRSVAGLADIVEAYKRATGLPVEMMVAQDFPALIRAQANGRIHYGMYSAVSYAALDRLCGCVEPLAAPRGRRGDIGVRVVSVERADARIDEREPMDVKIPGPHMLAPSADSPGGIAWGTVDANGEYMGEGAEFPDSVRRSAVLRYGPHVVRADMPAPLKDNLRRFLTIMRDHQPAIYELVERERGGGFFEVDRADYAAAFEILETVLADAK